MKKLLFILCFNFIFIQNCRSQEKYYYNTLNNGTYLNSFNYINNRVLTLDSKQNGGNEKFVFGFKGGVGWWKITSLGNGPTYSYPLGFTLGIFLENRLSQQFSIVNEFFLQNSITKITILTHVEGLLEQTLYTRYFNLPILLKYQTDWLANTYFYLGPSFAYLINAEYDFYDQIYHIGGNSSVTEKLPTISAGFEIGLGEKFKMYNSYIIMEIRTQLNITKFQPKDFDNLSIGEWKNSGLIFLIGYQF